MAYVNTVALGGPPPNLHVASGLSSAACTFCCWVKCTNWAVVSNPVAAVYGTVGAAPSPTDAMGAECVTGSALYWQVGNVNTGPEPTYTTPGSAFVGWVWVAFVVSAGGALTAYCATETNGPVVNASTTLTGIVSDLYVHTPFSPYDDAHAKYAAIKFWNTALTAAELSKEWAMQAPVKTANQIFYLSGNNGSAIGANEAGSGGNWTQINSGFTTDADLPVFGARVLQKVQATATATGTTIAATLPAAVTVGSALHVFSGNKDTSGATITVADGVNGSWAAALDSIDDTTNLQRTAQFSFPNSAAGSVTATATFSTTSLLRTIELCEIVGVLTASPLDVHTGQVQASPGAGTDAVTSGVVTNSKQPALVLGLSTDNRTVSPVAPAAGTGFTDLGAIWTLAGGNQARLESKRVTAIGSQAATFTGTAGIAPTTLVAVYDEIGASGGGTNTPPQKIYGSQPQAPSAFFGASLIIAGLIPAPKAPQIICGSALKQTSEYGSSRVVAVPAAPTASQLRGVIGSTLRAEDFVPYYGGTQIMPGSVYAGVAVSAQSIGASYLPPWNDYGSARTIPGLAPPALAPPVVYGSSAQPTSYLGSAVCIRGLTPAATSLPAVVGSALRAELLYGSTTVVTGRAPAAQPPTPQAIYGSAPKPTSDYGSARAISVLAPATQPPTPQTIYGSEPQITSDYGTTRIIAGSVPLAVLLPTIYGPAASQPTDYGYARAIKGLVPAPSVLPPTIYHAQLEQPSAFVGLATVVKGLAPAAQAAPPKVVSSTPQPPMLYGWSTYVKGTPAVIVPLQTIYGSRVNVSQDYGSARFIAGLMPAPIAAQTIFGPDALPVEAYGSARVIVGLVPAPVAPPTIYGSAPRPLHIDGLSRPVVGLIPTPLQLQRVYGAAPLQTAEYGLARFVRGLIPVIAVLPPTIYGSAPEQVSYYGGVVVVPGLKPKHGAIGCAIATDEQIAFALASDTCGCDL